MTLTGAIQAANAVLTSGAALTMAPAATLNAGTVNMTAVGHVTLGKVVGGAVAISSTAGSILDGTADELANATATTLSLIAAGSLGAIGVGNLQIAVTGAVIETFGARQMKYVTRV